MIQFRQHLIPQHTTVRDALGVLNEVEDTLMTLFVVDEADKMQGTVTDGDIRRALLNGASLEQHVDSVMNRNFKAIRKGGFSLEEFHFLKSERITLLPVLDEVGAITGVRDLDSLQSILPIDAVIMAGGEGQRLRPLTEHLPKPMLKVGDKPILEHNVDRLLRFGVTCITITLRYLGEKIKDYFGDGSAKGAEIKYVTEENKLGTLGAVGLIEKFHHDAVLVMNSDLLTNIDYEDFYQTFVNSGADMLIAAVPYTVNVPYAVLETEGNQVLRFAEKPSYVYHSNAGIYLIKTSLLKRVNGQEKYDATDFMQQLIEEGHLVVTYSLVQYWLDIGKHEDFQKAQADILHLHL